MTKLQPYREYKESGAEWLGRIPAEWDVLRIKMSVQTARNGIWGQDPRDGDFPVWCVRVADFDRKSHTVGASERTLRSVTPDELIQRKLHRGDLLLEKSGGGENNPVGFVVRFDHDDVAVCSNFVAKMQLNRGMDSRFWTYVHATTYSVRLTQRSIKQTSGIQNLDQTSYFNELAPFPPLETQSRIADFLDRETAQIDELIGKQERLIELLNEKRQAIITHAVTRGLDPTAPTKPSSIPWLGEIPETWRTAELKRALNFITSGSRGWAEYYADHGKPFVRIGNLTRGHLHLNMAETQHVEVPPDAEGTRAVVEASDVLFSITAYLGSVAVATEKESGSYVSQHVAITRLDQKRLNPRFLAYFVLSEFGQRQLNEGAYGGTKLQLSLEDIKKLMIPVPGISEQIEIARHLDASTARIDALIEMSRKSISLLRERRSALISAAVTGKIDVQEGAA